MSDHNYSELECKIIREQIARRARYRCEFLRKRTDPCKHSMEAGYVFDEAIQRFVTMKTLQYQYFKPSTSSAIFGIATIVPMILYGLLAHHDRATREMDIRCGILKYKDRLFKLQ